MSLCSPSWLCWYLLLKCCVSDWKREFFFFFFPLFLLCCRLPDCWSIKIIVMEIDLIDNLPSSHCEQLVSREHNPETPSKNFPAQTFNPRSALLCKTKGANPRLSKSSKTGGGVKLKDQEGEGGADTDTVKRRIDQNSFPVPVRKIQPSSLCLIGNSAAAQSACTCQERWHLDDPPSPEPGLWLSLRLSSPS